MFSCSSVVVLRVCTDCGNKFPWKDSKESISDFILSIFSTPDCASVVGCCCVQGLEDPQSTGWSVYMSIHSRSHIYSVKPKCVWTWTKYAFILRKGLGPSIYVRPVATEQTILFEHCLLCCLVFMHFMDEKHSVFPHLHLISVLLERIGAWPFL